MTLSGKVESDYDKPHAKILASRVRGVAEVVDKLTVNWGQERDDATVFKKHRGSPQIGLAPGS